MGYSDDVEKYDNNIEKAKELLKNSGVKDLKLTIAFGTHKSQLETTALVVQSNLKEIGIDVELKPMEKSAYFAKLNNPSSIDFDLGLNGYVMGNEPNDYAPLFLSGNMSNYGGYENKDLDAKFIAALKETDKAKRDEIYKEIQQNLALNQ